jgi:hypothetical protein
VLSAEGAVLVELQTLSGVALVLGGVVVALFALGTPQRDLHTVTGFRHIGTSFKLSPSKQKTPERLCRFRRLKGYKDTLYKLRGIGIVLPPCDPVWRGRGFLDASRKNAHKKKALFTGTDSVPQAICPCQVQIDIL